MNTQNLLKLVRVKRHQPALLLAQLVASFERSNEDRESLNKIAGALRAGQFSRAITVSESLVPALHGPSDEANYFFWTQIAHLLRKVPWRDSALKPEEEAWKKFLASEHSCRRINQRIRAERRVGREPFSYERAIARSWIQKVLGDEPDIKRILELCGFGPGAAVGVHGSDTTSAQKLSQDWSVTPSCAPFASCALSDDFHIAEDLYPSQGGYLCYDSDALRSAIARKMKRVDYNKITMVPKTAKVHRTIAIEPLLNGYVQKGADLFMRSALRRFGIDLSDQTRNQKLACEGSLGGFNPFVTIDLSAASDSLAIETVRDLLPPEWFRFLNSIRSPSYESSWGNGRYEKFASMGNGFCFPLETLIFASLCVAANVMTGEREFSVYGDDIIVRQSAALLLIDLLGRYGFKTNVDKTFLFGPFRESCGADYIRGVNVRPYVLDFLPETDRDVIKIFNGLHVNDSFKKLFDRGLEILYREIQNYPHKPHLTTEASDDAVSVPHDVYMSHWSARWHRHEQRWRILRFQDRGLPRKGKATTGAQMYGLLRGTRPDQAGLPEFTLRRTTRTVLSWN
jgi:hypothetical protein